MNPSDPLATDNLALPCPPHYWLVAGNGNGPMVPAKCAKCGAERTYTVHIERSVHSTAREKADPVARQKAAAIRRDVATLWREKSKT